MTLDVDTTLYPISAVMRAAYKFTGAFHVAIRRSAENPDQRVTVALTSKVAARPVDERALVGDFQNELIDQRLRETLEAEFGPVRELIVAHAFSDTNLLDPARDDGDYVHDALGIGLPGTQSNAVGESESSPRKPATDASHRVALLRDRSPAERPGPSVIAPAGEP